MCVDRHSSGVWSRLKCHDPYSRTCWQSCFVPRQSTDTIRADWRMNFDKKDEDTGALFHLDRTQVFQDARAFNASPIQPKKCRVILTKIKCASAPAPCVTHTANSSRRSLGQRRSMEHTGSNRAVLWHHQALSTQRCMRHCLCLVL
jgi:hypothetical protein